MKGQNKHGLKHRRLRKRKLWKDAVKRRRIKHFFALPKKIQKELVIVHEYVMKHDPKARMKLTGSWLKGTWADENTSREFRRHLLEVKNKIGLSDLDIILQSEYDFTREELQALVSVKLDIWKQDFDSVKGITIAPAPKYINMARQMIADEKAGGVKKTPRKPR